jgi:hypothetical protein
MRRIALWTAVCAGAATAGCATVNTLALAPSDSTKTDFSYTAGRATQDLVFPLSVVLATVPNALEDLRINSVRQTRDAGVVIFEGTTADNRSATVAVRPRQGTTRVTVRIGWFGDEPLSRALLDRLGVRLGSLPPSAIPVNPPSSPDPNPFFSRDAVPDAQMLREQAESRYRDTPIPRF